MQQEARQTVKLSKQTIEVLRNFSAINKSILIEPGKFVETMSVNKNIIAATDIREGIPEQMAIYDLPLFLGALSLFKSPTLFFPDSKKVVIYDEDTKGKTTFYYSDPEIIGKVPEFNPDLLTFKCCAADFTIENNLCCFREAGDHQSDQTFS